ncbi:hypothetical protein [Natronorubrum sp. DTA28]|uniref:hypothetical protein n=1 Tax=Natronorubrum sp. DTA28 TaxID=3447019 RepID=UPI003F83EFB8
MDVPARRQDSDSDSETLEEPSAVVSSHEPRPGKLIITERGNTDGWIAADCAVDLQR